MQLRRLELSGIGPFARTYTIDFDSLCASGLFLLDGPTGSGKTTIIDAITWALYGGVAGGSDSTDERMRSTHADPSRESYVDLVFSVASGTYRVRRVPSWTKAGNKNPTNPQAKLWRISEGALETNSLEAGEILETKPRDVGPACTNLIGLNREQFVQTIVLPQGKFADFLRLDSSKRAALLEHIFDTRIYRRVAEELHARATGAQEEIGEAQASWKGAVSAFAASLDLDAEASEELATACTITAPEQSASAEALIDGHLNAARADAEAAQAAVKPVRKASEAALAKLEEERRLAEALNTRRTLLARREHLLAERPTIAAHREALASHTAALSILPYASKSETARSACREAEDILADLGVEAAAIEGDALGLEIAQAQEAYDAAVALGATLREARTLEEETEARREQFSALTAQAKDVAGELADLAKRREELPGEISAAEATSERRRVEAAQLPARRQEIDRLTAQLASLKDLEAARSRRSEVAAKAEAAAAEHERARSTANAISATWISSMAANIAETLEDGHACPVCGSLDHPSPAARGAEHATREDVDRADAIVGEHRATLDAANEVLAQANGEVARLEEDLAGISKETLDDELVSARAAADAAMKAEAALASLTKKLAAMREEETELAERHASLASSLAAVEASASAIDTRISEAEEKISPIKEGFASIADRITSQAEERRQAGVVLTTLRSLEASRADASKRSAELAETLRASCFATVEEARAAVLPESSIKDLTTRITTHDRDVDTTEHELSSPAIKDLTGNETPDVERAAQESRSATEAATFAASEAALAADRAARAEHAGAVVEQRRDTWEEVRAKAGAIVRLANLADGTSESLTRIPLATFVVQQRFDQIVERANERLAEISLGRYCLERIDEKERGSRERKTGLGLAVIDRDGELNGAAQRSPKSLSGGETFYVSLSLALALADVVRAENGGISLDTLLIDEGFGSLDSGTLDLVMSTLTGLSAGGRTVGLVSHVAEMKKMIAEHISVRQLEDGSSSLEVTA